MAGPSTPGDILAAPRYYAAEAARLIGVTPGRARRWWQGYIFSYELANGTAKHGRSSPAARAPTSRRSKCMSFLDLMDLLLVRRMRDHGVSLQKVRKHFRELLSRTQGRRPARSRFLVWARRVFLQNAPDEMPLELGAGGQTAFRGALEAVAEEVDIEAESLRALRWYPPGHDRRIVVDPAVLFGQPHLHGHRLSTDAIYDLFQAENGRVSAVADWYAIEQEEVTAAVDFHAALVA